MTTTTTFLPIRPFIPRRYYRTAKPQRIVEHLYGASSVLSALQTGRRKLRKLYLQDTGPFHERKQTGTLVDQAIQLARRREVGIVHVPGSRLDALSDGRPHQGMILAASPLELPQLRYMGVFEEDADTGDGRYSGMVTERETIPFSFSTRDGQRRYPVWLAIDQVMDPRNLGSIIRTAHFFDLDGMIVTEQETSPLSATVSKSSAGALEIMSLYVTPSLPKLLTSSSLNGWHIYGTGLDSPRTISLTSYLRAKSAGEHVPQLIHAPTILVLGSEGEGLRSVVSKACHDHLVIGDADKGEIVGQYSLDSLNVGVAAGVLVHALVTD